MITVPTTTPTGMLVLVLLFNLVTARTTARSFRILYGLPTPEDC